MEVGGGVLGCLPWTDEIFFCIASPFHLPGSPCASPGSYSFWPSPKRKAFGASFFCLSDCQCRFLLEASHMLLAWSNGSLERRVVGSRSNAVFPAPEIRGMAEAARSARWRAARGGVERLRRLWWGNAALPEPASSGKIQGDAEVMVRVTRNDG